MLAELLKTVYFIFVFGFVFGATGLTEGFVLTINADR